MGIEEHINKIFKAYSKRAVFQEGIISETEEELTFFEKKYDIVIPNDYRWLLKHFGGCYFIESCIFNLRELEAVYSAFQEIFKRDRDEYIHKEGFPIGRFYDGSFVFIDSKRGTLYRYNIDNNNLEYLSENIYMLILDVNN